MTKNNVLNQMGTWTATGFLLRMVKKWSRFSDIPNVPKSIRSWLGEPGKNWKEQEKLLPGKPFWRERLNTVDLLVLTCLDQLLIILKILFTFFTVTSYINVEVNCTEPSPFVSVPGFNFLLLPDLNAAAFSVLPFKNVIFLHYCQGQRWDLNPPSADEVSYLPLYPLRA